MWTQYNQSCVFVRGRQGWVTSQRSEKLPHCWLGRWGGAVNQAPQAPLDAGKARNGHSARTPEGPRSCWHFDFSPLPLVSSVWTLKLQDNEFICFKPLNVWQFVIPAIGKKHTSLYRLPFYFRAVQCLSSTMNFKKYTQKKLFMGEWEMGGPRLHSHYGVVQTGGFQWFTASHADRWEKD